MEDQEKALEKLLEGEYDEHPTAIKIAKIVIVIVIVGITCVCLSKLYLGW